MSQEAFVTVMRAPDLATAQVVRGALEAEGIACVIPDEIVAGQLWQYSGAIGGIRIDVSPEDEEAARAVLAELSQSPEPTAADGGEDVSAGDRVANRARKTALIGFMLWPLVHPYALSLSLRALSDPTLTPGGRSQARFAATISVLAVSAFFGLLYAILS